jgi:hypothetical protein
MATRWLYETATGTNYCTAMTADDSQTSVPEWDGQFDSLQYAWSAPDPQMGRRAKRNLSPRKKYNPKTNTVHNCTAAEIAAWDLRLLKAARNLEVDRKTMQLFNQGLAFEGGAFPLDLDDSLNYMRMQLFARPEDFPWDIAQRNRDSFTIRDAAHLKRFGDAATARQQQIVDGAQTLKKAIYDASDEAAVNAIVDDRK